MNWYVYIARCSDGSLYTGITTDVKRREVEHNTDNYLGAKSLRGKRPIKIIHAEMYRTQSRALKREKQIKGWRREKKISLIKSSVSKGLALRNEETKGA